MLSCTATHWPSFTPWRPLALQDVDALMIAVCAAAGALSPRAIADTHLPNAFESLPFLPQSSLNAGVPMCVRSALHMRDGFGLVPPPPSPSVVLGSRNVVVFTFTLRRSTVCSLSVNAGFVCVALFQPASTTNEIFSIVCEPSSVSAAAHVEHCVPPANCDVSTRHASDVPTRLPVESHVFLAQPVNVPAGPR